MDIITYALCRKNGGGGGGGDNTHFIGTTTTAITDGATTNPITVDGESYTAVKGDIVIYDSAEFIFDGSAWQSFGGTMDAQPTKDSAKAVTSDGVYRYTAGQKEYTNNTLKGEIFNSYNGQYKNVASGDNSHAEGFSTTASGERSHAEGWNTYARGISSHAEGAYAQAVGSASHAEGNDTTAQGSYSHAGGDHTIANTNASTTIGKYNIADGTGSSDPKHLFIIGNGTGFNARSNILEVSDTYLNLNGIFKQNGQVIDFSTLGDEIIEMSDIEYNTLATKDPDKVYFVYEAVEDNRTITAYDSNGDFMYTMTMYGCAASGISLNSKTTTPPTITAPDRFGSGAFIFEVTFADGNTYYFSTLFTDGRTGYSISNNSAHVSDAYGSNLFFAINGNRFTLMFAPNVAWISSIHIDGYDESSFELAITPKPNGFKRIYKGDELYATLNPTPIEEVSTITATTTEQSITFTEDCDYVWFRNLGDNDCYVSNHSNILIGADDVAIVKAGGGTRIAVPANKTVYIKSAQGTSVVEVHGQNSECAPFKPSGGTPNEYIKDATINSNTGSLTLTKKDGTTVILPVSSVPAENSTTLINSDGIYRNTAGKRYYVQGSHAGGEIFNCYMGNGENVASGAYSHAEGFMTSALDGQDHAEGYGTTASGGYSHAEGQLTSVYSESGHAEGNNTHVGSAVVDPETGTTTYTGTNAKYAHAEGESSLAAANCAHAEGFNTKATGIISHAEGYSTQATGDGAHSEGYATIAAGGNSHAEGHTTLAQGLNSHAGGFHTQANTNDSTVIGRYNVADGTGENDPKHLFIIGNGTANNSRSNIVEVSDSYLNVNGDIKKNGVALGSLAMKSSASGTAVTTVGTLPSLTYDSTTESFTFSAGTLPTTGTVTVS